MTSLQSEGRPAANGPAPKSLSITDIARLLADPDVVALIAYVGEMSRELGYEQAERDMAAAWKASADPVRRVLKQPTFDERQRRRYGVRHGVNNSTTAVTR